ncbi:MAG: 4-hydroxybutyrate CoA-transferase [Muribaculaceae bacterium]|nr:4-hydroxybutyrate CoA-transferase [Muribaculaceae bacterium]
MAQFESKLMTADQAVKLVKSGDNIFVQGSSSIPEALIAALARRGDELENVTLYNAFAMGRRVSPLCDLSLKDSFLIDSFFVSNAVRSWVNAGYATTTPRFFGQVPQLFREGSIKLDVAFVNCSTPDENGYVSFGVSADLTPSAVEVAKLIIAQINPQMPFTYGDSVIHTSRLDAMVMVDDPLAETGNLQPTEREIAIGRHVAALVPDGAVLQIGVGSIPNAILHALGDHRHLGIHTEALTEGMVDLIRSGVVDNSRKQVEPGLSVASLALGTRRLYDFMDHNRSILMRDIAWVNDPFVIAQNQNMVAINSCLEIDLSGQVCADSIGTRIYSGVGGQQDFVYGSSRSDGGQSFIVMLSTTSRGESKIKPVLTPGAGVVTTRFQTNWVVTEHGAVNLRGRNMIDRARMLISIAAPEFREELDRAAFEMLGYAYRRWHSFT